MAGSEFPLSALPQDQFVAGEITLEIEYGFSAKPQRN